MLKSRNNFGRIFVTAIIFTILLVSCNRPGTEPTIDPNLIFTSAAQTVQAQLTSAAAPAAVDPNAIRTQAAATVIAQMQNQLPATVPVAPTLPQLGGATLAIPTIPGIGTANPLVTLPVAAIKTATPGGGGVSTADKFQLVGQNPADGTRLALNYTFDMVWTIQNLGTNTWAKGVCGTGGQYVSGYYMEFWNSSNSTRVGNERSIYCFSKDVPPNEKIDLIADMTTPGSDGSGTSWWVVKNDKGQQFGIPFYVKLVWGKDTGPGEETVYWKTKYAQQTKNSLEEICCSSPTTLTDTCKSFLNYPQNDSNPNAKAFCTSESVCVGSFTCK
jgi:hypothetical protein